MIDWIKREDETPEDKEWILIWHRVLGCMKGRYVKRNNSWRVSGKLGIVPRVDITHWARINRPTKGSGEEQGGLGE